MIWKLLLLSVIIIGLAFAGIAVKMLFRKDYTFKKTCSSVDPTTGKHQECSCGGHGEGTCHNDPRELN